MKRKATANWQGTGMEGTGQLNTTSGVFNNQPYSFKTRFKNEDGTLGTNPEELIAAAYAGCFNMALSFQLQGAGFIPENLHTEAILTMENSDGHFKITGIELDLEATVPGLEEDKFLEVAAKAKNNCPVSQALSAIDIMLKATLQTKTFN
ncbi:OsmC family protein [Aequorivita antarctica]|uniref:OsmC family protein n=1 Tax=Aequorivita antarctica TaxID=153266 RepID=A0A5C6YWF9_9FLAO|nr:OsmC family protein [Aequorivita antarctica]TXD71365.1 OsmC family protein [Aequorivita antarctica]